jgi:hypothetical protein
VRAPTIHVQRLPWLGLPKRGPTPVCVCVCVGGGSSTVGPSLLRRGPADTSTSASAARRGRVPPPASAPNSGATSRVVRAAARDAVAYGTGIAAEQNSRRCSGGCSPSRWLCFTRDGRARCAGFRPGSARPLVHFGVERGQGDGRAAR